MDIGSLPGIIITGIIAGIVATAFMTLFLEAVTKSGLAHADMVKAIGSMVTKSLHNAFKTGIVIHFAWGTFFGICYAFILAAFNVRAIAYTAAIGGSIGFVHGFAVSLMLVVVVAEHHPMEKFRNPGLEVAVAHFIAHCIYGLAAGLMVGLLGY
ncbi:MAG: hypothetical protein HF314_16235 [Ignavibacteria bacterium]|jgi:hypothetical protein|nr:hypothetical protein [Ignavibacteria bacterium]MCU7504631.1 hypothetical protein [Ignavibacteria bacterium]MCU7517561.1 hypothetical protein [Ignavibacteria bacterium]